MNINMSLDSTKIILKGLVMLQQKLTIEYSNTLKEMGNPCDIAVCAVREELLDVSNLIGIFSEV